eukprot:TRINITY_DN2463_c0_g1_i3.p1 TRINITY_DN2463_c0_g1~~TRINITY_DN2463_c0_g1_i3.p1  ORF type:complete len:581 (+),score=198.27 TRINITY_DN2463_c0_g1_i3:53-1744(+)
METGGGEVVVAAESVSPVRPGRQAEAAPPPDLGSRVRSRSGGARKRVRLDDGYDGGPENGSGVWSPSRGDREPRPPFTAPVVVHRVGGDGVVELVSITDMLRMCGAAEERQVAAGIPCEPDTPCASAKRQPAATPCRSHAGALTPTSITSRIDSVITPASYARVVNASPGTPAQQREAAHCARTVSNLLTDSYDAATDTFSHSDLTPGQLDTLHSSAMALLDHAENVLRGEPLLRRIRSGCWVLGDVHGNYRDLHYFLRRVMPFNEATLATAHMLFLGDYVDRGPYSVECVLRVMSMLVLAPQRVTLLRGNHEDPAICGDKSTYGQDCFALQCERVFGAKRGSELFHKSCEVFALLPLAATIDDRVFCAHGGIPRFWKVDDKAGDDRIELLTHPSFPRSVSLFSPAVGQGFREAEQKGGPEAKLLLERMWVLQYDLMWSDPVKDGCTELDTHGFGKNDRGTTIVSFSAQAVDVFLRNHDFDVLIRAHQEKRAGLRLSQSSKVITVFSSSNYQGHGNGAGVVLVRPDGRIDFLMKLSAPVAAPVPASLPREDEMDEEGEQPCAG